jgi:hypothetical protein
MQPSQEPTVPLADILDTRRPRPDSNLVRPDGWLPAEPGPAPQPVDNKGVPAAVLADQPESMDDVLYAMGAFAHPYSFESDHKRPVAPPDPRPGT